MARPSCTDENANATVTSVHVGLVSYVDYQHAELPRGDYYSPFVHKRLGFQYEAEVRALVNDIPLTPEDGFDFDVETSAGKLFPVDLGELVEALYISPVAPEWLHDLVRRICARYESSAAARKSALSAMPIY
jgi:hypothetical protein